MTDTQTTVRAADLAERIVDEISQTSQDWSAIELHARELVELVAELAADGISQNRDFPSGKRSSPSSGIDSQGAA